MIAVQQGLTPAWLRAVSRQSTAQIKAGPRANPDQQQAMADRIAHAVRVLAEDFPQLAELAAKRVAGGHAEAWAEFPDPADPLSLVYRVDVVVKGEAITLARVPWVALGLTLDHVRAEWRNRAV